MTLQTLVRKDLWVARANGDLTGYAAMFAIVGTGIGYADANAPAGATDVAQLLALSLSFLVPLTALLTSYESVAGERESGSVRLLCTLPHSRRDVVLGTFVGRATMIAAHAIVAVATASVVSVALGGASGTELVNAASLVLPTMFLGAAYVAIAVGVSASVARGRTALAGAIAVGLGSVAAWSPLASLLRYVAAGFSSPTGPAPAWATALPHLSPLDAYQRTVALLAPGGTFGDGSVVGVLVLAAWVAVPLAVGRRRFARAPL